MRLYMAGPMTGYPACNRPLFHPAADRLTGVGYSVCNPARLPDGGTWEDDLAQDLADLRTCDGLVLLPGWEASRGVARELAAARAAGIPTWTAQQVLVSKLRFLRAASGLPRWEVRP